MRKILFTLIALIATTVAMAQGSSKQAKKILDRTAALVGRSGGAMAQFTVSGGKLPATSGTLAIKGQMFHATTPKATVWYNGRTQWSYMKSTNEVNVSTPTEAKRMRMNPYTFLTMYRSGYNLSAKTVGGNHEVRMVAQNSKRTIAEVVVTVNQRTYAPSAIRWREGKTWTTIKITDFKAKNLPNSLFTFRAKDFPTADVIDLR